MQLPQWLQLLLLLLLIVPLSSRSPVLAAAARELTELKFERSAQFSGEILAYVDFDADGWTDLIALETDQAQRKLEKTQKKQQDPAAMLPQLASSQTLLTSDDLVSSPNGSCSVEAVAVADFNGDALPDLLISVRDDHTARLRLWVAYGRLDRRSVGHIQLVTEALDQPTLLDFNADLLTDFLVEVAVGAAPVVFAGRYMEFSFKNITNALPVPDLPALSSPNANLFVDLTDDLRSDLLLRVGGDGSDSGFVLLTASDRAAGFELRKLPGSQANVSRNSTASSFPALPAALLPPENGSAGSSSDIVVGPPEPFAADEDAGIDLALPACLRSVDGRLWRCGNSSSAVWIYSSGLRAWCSAGVDGLGSRFALHPELQSNGQQQLRLRAADVDLDGHRDLLCLLRRLSDGVLLPGLLRSVLHADDGDAEGDDEPDDGDGAVSRCRFRFQAEALPVAAACPTSSSGDSADAWHLAVAAPAEVDLDGSMDLLTVCRKPDGAVASRVFSQVHSQPGNFFRIQAMTSARCSGPSPHSCPLGRLPQGLPAPGPCIRLVTERPSGGSRAEVACQLAQSAAHGRLPLPDVQFGLGQYSNYIERLSVAVADNAEGRLGDDGSSRPRRQQDYSFIMPNSLLLVSPYPPDQPHQWRTWLIVRPFSHPHIWGVGLAFLLASGLAFAAAGALQLGEYRRDRAERAAATPAGFIFDPH